MPFELQKRKRDAQNLKWIESCLDPWTAFYLFETCLFLIVQALKMAVFEAANSQVDLLHSYLVLFWSGPGTTYCSCTCREN